MDRMKKVAGLSYPYPGQSVAIPAGIPQKKPSSRPVRRTATGQEAAQGLFGYFCAVLLCLALLLGQGVYINNQGMDIGKLNGMINSYKLENDKNLIKISNMSSLENIEKIAINDYNMVRAEKVQYILR